MADQTITTNIEAELDALPGKSVILDRHGDAASKLGDLWHYPETAPLTSHRVAKYGPLTVLHRGDGQYDDPAEPTTTKRDDLRDRLADALGDESFVCTRVWEAWHYGTMTADDFMLAHETELLDDLVNASTPLLDEIIRLTALLAERANPRGSDDEVPYIAAATRAVMRHYGYTDKQITDIEAAPGHTPDCELDGYHWNCEDEDGRSHHPDVDELNVTTEILRVALEDTLLPVLAERDTTIQEMRERPRDDHHTMAELYEYRMLYNAHAALGWLSLGYPVVKSWKHSDGEPCFGGGWFIVTATLPTGQVSNHYEAQHWASFDVPEVDLPPEWDGHTPAEAADRLRRALDAGQTDGGPPTPTAPEDITCALCNSGDDSTTLKATTDLPLCPTHWDAWITTYSPDNPPPCTAHLIQTDGDGRG